MARRRIRPLEITEAPGALRNPAALEWHDEYAFRRFCALLSIDPAGVHQRELLEPCGERRAYALEAWAKRAGLMNANHPVMVDWTALRAAGITRQRTTWIMGRCPHRVGAPST